MKKILMVLLSAFLMGPLNGVKQIANASTATDYDVKASVALYDISYDFYDIYNTAFKADAVTFEADLSHSYVSVFDTNGNVINADNDYSDDGNNTSANLNGLDYELSASSTHPGILEASLGGNAGYFSVNTGQNMTFTSSLKGLMKINFSYDLTMEFSDFNENNNNFAYINIYVSKQEESPSSEMISFNKYFYPNDRYEEQTGTGEFFVGIEADKFYSLSATAGTNAGTEPLHTPVPATVWLLCSGLVGIIGARRKLRK